MPQAKRSSTTRSARISKAPQQQAATQASESGAAEQLEAMLSQAALRAPVLLPANHPDAALGKACITLNSLRALFEPLCAPAGLRAAEEPGQDDGIADAIVVRWDSSIDQLAQLRPLTHEGLRMKALAMADAIRMDARADAAGELTRPREFLALAVAEDALRLLHPDAPLPPPTPSQQAVPEIEICEEEAPPVPSPMEIKCPAASATGDYGKPLGASWHSPLPAAGDRVQFVTASRAGRSEPRAGTVAEVYGTWKGAFVRIRGDDGREYRARPSQVVKLS